MIRRLLRLARLGAIVLTLTIIAVVIQTLAMRHSHLAAQSLTERADVLLVLGGGIDSEGDLSFASKLRVFTGARLMRDGWAGRMIVSDGSVGRTAGAAQMMADYAIRLGVAPGQILLEDRARSTFANMRYSAQIMTRDGLDTVILLTDEVHLSRSRMLAWHSGLNVTGVAASGGIERVKTTSLIQYIVREAVAWWYNLGKIAVWSAYGMIGVPESARPQHW